jgi:class 3 adenylate cyclase
MDRPTTRYARSGDAYIAYQVVGDGPIDVLVIPHFFQHLELWWDDRHRTEFTRALAAFARVILVDKRGTGMSDRTGGMPPFDVQMDDVRAVLDAVGSQRTVIWAGGDATPMVILFAATFPKRIAGLVLWDPHPTYIANDDLPSLISRADWDAAVADTGASLEDPTGAAYRPGLPSIASDEEMRLFWRVSRLGTSRGDQLAFTRVLADTDVRHVLPTIRVPTLVVTNTAYADQHPVSTYVADRIPTARLTILPGRDRNMFVGNTDALMSEVSGFISELGDAPVDEVERVLATVLFTDIVESTALAARLGDAGWRELVKSHHGRVRRELARFRGRELDTAGDGFFAIFDGPARAIRCACAIRDSVRDLGIEVRAGLHAGECELLDEKVTGIAVALGARVAASADPGVVLVSSTVKDLVAGSGLRFADRGEFQLKGIPDTWRLFSVESSEPGSPAAP